MDFETLFNKISVRLKRIAKYYNSYGTFSDENDLYQEMSIYLWQHYKNGVPEGINESYIMKGCKFHILNQLRKERGKTTILSLEAPLNVNAGGDTLKDVLADTKEPFSRCIDRKLTIDEIRNNGFTRKEKEVLDHLLEGLTVRETGKKLGISHTMVLKFKKNIIKKWQRKNKGYQR